MLQRKDIVHAELAYRINGLLFNVFKSLGFGYQEKYYQRAVAEALSRADIKFSEQVYVLLTYLGKPIGRYFLDFLIEDLIVLEIKKGSYFEKQNIEQVLGYLKSKNLQLGLIANFTKNGVRVKRIVNLK